MKILTVAMLMAVMAVVGYVGDKPAAAETPAHPLVSVRESVPAELVPFAFACRAANAACLTVRECHQQEGTNIGIAGCPSGTTCCVF